MGIKILVKNKKKYFLLRETWIDLVFSTVLGWDLRETNINGSQNNHEESWKRRSPEKAMEEIRKQDTHDLYCPKCTCNITKTAQLFEKKDEFFPDNQNSFVHWIPLFIPFKFLSSSPTGIHMYTHIYNILFYDDEDRLFLWMLSDWFLYICRTSRK